MVKKKNYYKKYGNLFGGDSNPFNVKLNRKKHTVLGSDVKGTKGLPNISKGINYAKRKELFQKNKIASKKSNTYIGKRNQNSSFEDSVTARFMKEGQKKTKKNVFNLNEDSSGKMQNYQNVKNFNQGHLNFSDDEDITMDEGFATKGQGDICSKSDAPKSQKEVMEEIISESKQKKMERKKEKDKYLNTLEQVDNAWREIHFMGSKAISSKITSKIIAKEPVESNARNLFDISKSELKFEQKCSSISHTKTVEEISKEEEKKQALLEKEKLSRMNDDKGSNSKKAYDHLSADAICDEYEYLQPIAKVENNHEMLQNNSNSEDESSDSHSSSDEMDLNENDSEDEDKSFNEGNISRLEIPDNVKEFKACIKDCNAEQLDAVLSSICNKFVKSKNLKILNKLERFFEILLEYAFELCENKFPKLKHIGVIPPHLHALANAVNLGTTNIFLKFLDKEYQLFIGSKNRRTKRNFPRHQTITVLKFAALIYSTSDFRHPVVTPAMIFMCEILGSTCCITFINILSRLLISELILNSILDSKRFVPEAVYFLNNVLLLGVTSKAKPNMSSHKLFDLNITEKVFDEAIPTLDFSSSKDLTEENKKIAIIFTIIDQLLQYATLYSKLPSFKEVFSPTQTICSQLPINFYPVVLQKQIQELSELLQNSVSLHPLSFQKVKPKPLKMFEPNFESKFSKKDDINKKRLQIKKVAQKIKKEEKSMMREIRRNAQVAASEKMKEKQELDAERKRKVKEIYSSLAVQEGEFKKMMKKKP